MPIVPVIPVTGVPQKPTDPKPGDKTGLVVGYLFNEGSGLPKDVIGALNPSAPSAGASWVDTPWGKGYSIQNPLYFGSKDIPPPITFHVLFKPVYLSEGSAYATALVFGEADNSGNVIDGVGIKFGSSVDPVYAFGAFYGQQTFSYVPIQPQQNEWITISYTYDGTSASIYINGAPTLEMNQPTPAPTVSKRWVIGGPGFSGVVADARVYGRVLSDSEISTIASSPGMWLDYAGIDLSGHAWWRHVWHTQGATVRVARRVARVGR